MRSALVEWLSTFLTQHDPAITGLATVLLTFVTGGLVFVAYRQLKTTRAQLRAYVFVESAVTANVVDNGTGNPEGRVVIKNFGQTPAYEVISTGGLALDKFPPPSTLNLAITDKDFDEAVTMTTNMALAPGGTSLGTTPNLKLSLTPATRQKIIAGDLVVYVYGEIRYKDVFGRKQWTRYRFMQGGSVGVRGSLLSGCTEGNEAT